MKKKHLISLLVPAFLLTSCSVFKRTSNVNSLVSTIIHSYVPDFAVNLSAGRTKLVMSEDASFASKAKSIEERELLPFNEYTYGDLMDKVTFDAIDSQETTALLGTVIDSSGTPTALNFYKCTFFLKNTGGPTLKYSISINIKENKPSDDGRCLDDILRVAFFENSASSINEHMCYVLAKQSKTGHLDETGELDFREAISISEEDATEQYPFYGYAEKFEDENTIMTFNRNHFLANEVTRCTVLFWLEGFDPDNVIQEAPQDGSLKLSVDIKGSEDD